MRLLLLVFLTSTAALAQDDARSGTFDITLKFTLRSAVSMNLSGVAVAGGACEGGSGGTSLTQSGAHPNVDFGHDISLTDPTTVENGCAYRVENGVSGLHLVAAVRATVMVSGHPSAQVTLRRADEAASWSGPGVPRGYVKFQPHNDGTVDWKSADSGRAVPGPTDSPAVLLRGAHSGDSVEHQLAVFIPDASRASGTKSADILYTVTAE